MKRYPCQVCKQERMFSPRRKLCAKCVRVYGYNYLRGKTE